MHVPSPMGRQWTRSAGPMCQRVVVLLLASAASLAGGAVLASSPAGASSGAPRAAAAAGPAITSLKARAAEISAAIESEGREVGILAARYLQEGALAQTLQSQEGAVARQVAATELGVKADRDLLAEAAIAAYVGAGSAGGGVGGGVLPDLTDASATLEGQTYLQVVSGRLQEDSSALTASTARLRAEQAGLAKAAGAARAAVAATQAAERHAVAILAVEKQQLSSVQGELAQLVAAALAAQRAAAVRAAAAAAEEAARAAAAKAGRHRQPATPPPPPAPPPSRGGGSGGSGGSGGDGFVFPNSKLAADFASLRLCESGGNYATDTGNGYYGAYQFALATWQGLGFAGLPSAAPPWEQDEAAYELYERDGWGPWPGCSAMLGL